MTEKVTINHVTHDPKSDELVLYLVEEGPWPGIEAEWRPRLLAIQNRILAAADVAIDGQLSAQYPDSPGKPVRIQVDSPRGSHDRLEGLVEAVARFLADDPAYSAAVAESAQISGMRVVTGRKLGRFSKGSEH